MSNFEKITASPEELAAFLASLPVATGPWDEEFHARFCVGCAATCDVCPHAEERNNPLWWLTKAAEGERETAERPASIAAWKNGQVVLEPGTVIQIRKQERPVDGMCDEFNVYLNGKGPDGKMLRNIKKVILPEVTHFNGGRLDPMGMKLVFGRCEDAAEIIKRLGEKCKLEIRAAVRGWVNGQIEFHGYKYTLEATPFKIKPKPLKRQAGMGLEVWFQVDRYTATVGDTELWDFEWVTGCKCEM